MIAPGPLEISSRNFQPSGHYPIPMVERAGMFENG